jgi:hypothetical protein
MAETVQFLYLIRLDARRSLPPRRVRKLGSATAAQSARVFGRREGSGSTGLPDVDYSVFEGRSPAVTVKPVAVQAQIQVTFRLLHKPQATDKGSHSGWLSQQKEADEKLLRAVPLGAR